MAEGQAIQTRVSEITGETVDFLRHPWSSGVTWSDFCLKTPPSSCLWYRKLGARAETGGPVRKRQHQSRQEGSVAQARKHGRG